MTLAERAEKILEELNQKQAIEQAAFESLKAEVAEIRVMCERLMKLMDANK
jgi:hypothetical protein